MKLKVLKREHGTKGQISSLLQEGQIPAILYVKGKENLVISVDRGEFEGILRSIRKGFLSTTIFEIELDGKKKKALVKDIQYHKTTYNVIHLDFQEIYEDVRLNVSIPLEFTGVADCSGIKLGGFLRPVKRSIKVNCFPKDIPQCFSVDIRDLGIKQNKRVRDLDVKGDVRVLSDSDNVIVVIAK
jgi:large subunit ribosomal protein L25